MEIGVLRKSEMHGNVKAVIKKLEQKALGSVFKSSEVEKKARCFCSCLNSSTFK